MEQLFSDFIVHLVTLTTTTTKEDKVRRLSKGGKKLITVLGMKNEKLIKT